MTGYLSCVDDEVHRDNVISRNLNSNFQSYKAQQGKCCSHATGLMVSILSPPHFLQVIHFTRLFIRIKVNAVNTQHFNNRSTRIIPLINVNRWGVARL